MRDGRPAPGVERGRELSNEELLEMARSGDGAALGRLMETHKEDLRSHLRSKINLKNEDFDDVFIETFVGAQRTIGSFEGKDMEQFLGWLKRVARNKGVDAIRKSGRKEKREVLTEKRTGSQADEDARSVESLADPNAVSPLDQLISQVEITEVDKAIELLPEPLRTTVILRVREGMSNVEIGKEMNCAPNTASERFTKALDLLRKELSDLHGDDEALAA